MSQSTRSFAGLLALVSAASYVSAQTDTLPPGVTGTFPATPLASEHFSYPSGIPYQADSNTGLIRGVQTGYNQCNSTTEGPKSLCQTSFFNSISDFCLWAPPVPNSTVGDYEGQMVAWCTKPGRGTRLIPHDTIQGIQWIETPDYIMATGFIDQQWIDLQPGDYGGELDPHGADLRGNPLGGLLYSQAFGPGPDGNAWQQVVQWNNFIGGNAFCFKACNPASPNSDQYCYNRLDRIGCTYNMPSNAQNGTFESCKGDNQQFPGVYTSNGVAVTYTQPPESLGPITTMPYTPSVPASSECTTYTSSVIYSQLLTVSAPGQTAAPAATGTASKGTAGSSSKASSGSGNTTSSGSGGSSSDATTLAVGGVATLLGVVFSTLFFA